MASMPISEVQDKKKGDKKVEKKPVDKKGGKKGKDDAKKVDVEQVDFLTTELHILVEALSPILISKADEVITGLSESATKLESLVCESCW